jgi:hypothetical protein
MKALNETAFGDRLLLKAVSIDVTEAYSLLCNHEPDLYFHKSIITFTP